MPITMLVPIIRRCVPCDLRRIAACVTYRNKMRTRIARQCNESNLLSVSSPSIAACRTYSTESPDSEPRASLPALVVDADVFMPSLLTPFHLFFLSFTTLPHIDKEFRVAETLQGVKYAITVISKALANKDYDSLDGLVAEDMIEVLRTRIESFSPEERWLIALSEEDIMFSVLCGISVKTGEEHSIEIKVICHYVPEKDKKLKTLSDSTPFTDIYKLNLSNEVLICNYTFTRKYVNSIGGSWIATFVNHYSASNFMK